MPTKFCLIHQSGGAWPVTRCLAGPAPATGVATGGAWAPATDAPAAGGNATTGTGAASGAVATSVDAIRAGYAPRLEAVQVSCEGELNAMLESAKAEYNQAKADGGTVDVAALGARYIARADGLRRQCDRQVNAITREMAADLRAAGLPLDLVDEVQSAYETRIIERQAEIMAKAPAQ